MGCLRHPGIFEDVPRVELAYSLPDGLRCQAVIRLPLSAARMASPLRLPPERFLELWSSDDFLGSQVAILCRLPQRDGDGHERMSRSLQCAQQLELGGSLHGLTSLGESS